MSTHEKYTTRERLLACAASWLASEHYLNSAQPGPDDDAEMGLKDDHLLIAAREFVEAHANENPILG